MSLSCFRGNTAAIKTTSAAARFPPEPLCAPAVRRFVADVAMRWGLGDVGILILLASELATNAILHGRTDFEVKVELRDELVRVEVHDENTRAPVPALVPGDATTGRGLLMVQSLAYRWGIDGEQGGKSVWFELPYRAIDARVPT